MAAYDLLVVGDVFRVAGTSGEVKSFLGSGTQGEVYLAEVDGEAMALKWYFPNFADGEQHAALSRLVNMPPPSPRFLWPSALCESDDRAGFGYVMPLRPSHFRSLYDLVTRKVDPSFRTICAMGMHLADAYLRLHTQGLCYKDISFGNAFFNPGTGDVLVCDNDNVGVDGQGISGIQGTQRFMAPEIVRGEAEPSTDSDLFSLSVLLFYLLMIAHPLEGAAEARIHSFDLHAMKHLYGEHPLFIFDPQDSSNQPEPGFHDNAIVYWPIYTPELRQLFTEAFTVGLHQPQRRVRETQWRTALSNARDRLFYCVQCNAENFLTLEKVQPPCWNCKRAMRIPMVLKLGRNVIALTRDTQIHRHHLIGGAAHDLSDVVAEVTQNPNDSTRWGLRNIGTSPWRCRNSVGEGFDVEPSRAVTIRPNLEVNFGLRSGHIHGGDSGDGV